MKRKYESYLDSPGCGELIKDGFEQALENIINDDESFITEASKKAFFEHMEKFRKTNDILDYCDDFFYQPINESLANKTYLLKGKPVSKHTYEIELGRVTAKTGFRRGLNSTVFKASLHKASVAPISDIQDEALLDSFIIDYAHKDNFNVGMFKDFLVNIGIQNEKIQENPMWTFEGLYDDVFYGYEIVDLPCILGLAGSDGRTAKDYKKIERIAFSLNIPRNSGIIIRKPTSFDAGINVLWRGNGRTNPHVDCLTKYVVGFLEYIHEPISFSNITSLFYKV